MIKTLIPFLLILLVSCGSKSDGGATPGGLVEENIEFKDDLGNLKPIKNACDIFSDGHNLYFKEFQTSFPALYSGCQNYEELDVTKISAMMESYAFAFEILGGFDRDAHIKCVPLTEKLIKNIYSSHLRNLKPDSAKRQALKVLSKTRIDNNLRGLIRLRCLPDFNSFTYLYNGEEKQFEFLSNHLLNGSFEYFKSQESQQFTQLGREWTLVEGQNVPGWRLDAINPVGDKKCDYLEFQGENVVTSIPDGIHIVELDSHCTNKKGKNIPGDARVELSQKVPVKEAGSYKLTLKAQKRDGSNGELDISIHQRGSDKEFQRVELPNQAIWSGVCIDVEIQDIEKRVNISIRDGEESGRFTRGLLIDDVSFGLGSCE